MRSWASPSRRTADGLLFGLRRITVLKRYFKQALIFVMSAALLTGCGDFSFEFSPGEGFSAEEEYTELLPGTAKGEEPESPETEGSYAQERSETAYAEQTEASHIADEQQEIFEETVSSDSESTITAAEQKNEDIFSTFFSENVENNTVTIDTETNIPAVTEGMYTESIFVPKNTESNKISAYTYSADANRIVMNLMENMTLEEKAAQLILARCPSENAATLMEQYQFGGYTLYAVDFADRTPRSAKSFISEIKTAAKISPFIAVDEEGGEVVRVSKYPAYRDTPFDSIQNVYKNSGIDGIIADTKEKTELLVSLGINLNLAPVADIAEEGDYIYSRTAGCDAEKTGEIVRRISDVSGSRGVMSCFKHFPGYGGNTDTHTGISRDSRSMEEFRSNDFIPFKEGITSYYSPAILVNHNIIECMDSNAPASLSPEVHRVLREELGFNGVIITDDLGMDGIKAYTGKISPYAAGILAGNDMLCVSEPVTAYNDIINAVKDGTLTEDNLNEHVTRVLMMKSNGNIL